MNDEKFSWGYAGGLPCGFWIAKLAEPVSLPSRHAQDFMSSYINDVRKKIRLLGEWEERKATVNREL